MNKKNQTTTLIFDFGGVLINLDLQKCIENLKNTGFDHVEQFLSNFGQKDFFLHYENGQINTEVFRNEIRKNASKQLSDIEIDMAWCSFLCDIPAEKIKLLKELRKNYRLLLLSNTNPLHIENSAEKALSAHHTKLDQLFDKCYLSYEMGLTKPNDDIFIALLNDANVTAQECLFLDDGPKNIETAARLGFQTYLVEPNQNLDFLLNLK